MSPNTHMHVCMHVCMYTDVQTYIYKKTEINVYQLFGRTPFLNLQYKLFSTHDRNYYICFIFWNKFKSCEINLVLHWKKKYWS